MPAGDTLRDPHRRAFAQIVDIRLKGQPKTGDFHFAGAFIGGRRAICDRGFYLIDHPVRFAVVHFTRGANQSRLLRILRHNKPRIDRNAVPANARARLQNIDARMAVRQRINSQTLIPCSAQISDNSFAKAIFTSRKLFSVSLHISAVRELVTTHSPSRKILYSALARAEHTGVIPPITRSF